MVKKYMALLVIFGCSAVHASATEGERIWAKIQKITGVNFSYHRANFLSDDVSQIQYAVSDQELAVFNEPGSRLRGQGFEGCLECDKNNYYSEHPHVVRRATLSAVRAALRFKRGKNERARQKLEIPWLEDGGDDIPFSKKEPMAMSKQLRF